MAKESLGRSGQEERVAFRSSADHLWRHRRRAAGAGPRARLTNADQILATVLYLRRLCAQAVLGELLAMDRSKITEAIREIRPLLEEHGHAITPATARFPAPADLIAFLAALLRRRCSRGGW